MKDDGLAELLAILELAQREVDLGPIRQTIPIVEAPAAPIGAPHLSLEQLAAHELVEEERRCDALAECSV